ncbi:MAG: hypothetical protein ABL961_11730 [Vicinamibacterales bacterium]
MKITLKVVLAAALYLVLLHAVSPRHGVSVLYAESARRAASPDGDAFVERFLQSDRPALTSYRARRRLQAETMGGRMRAVLDAWTYIDAEGRLQFDVIAEEGSGLIRDRVLRQALLTEQDNYNRREVRRVELNRDNYDFTMGASAGDLVAIEMQPRRISPMLLTGTVAVTRRDGDLVRIDGTPSELPSWWTRRVDIVRRYTRIEGVRVPIEMSSRADVRIAGESTFTMTYAYTMINGRALRE